MLTYSVAIRTLGRSPNTLRKELVSLHAQTVKPKEIIIYIAQGCQRPDFTIGIEQYVFTDKGMVAQRAVPYNEISSEYILLLDDDVAFETDSIERVLKLMEVYEADCIAYDTFENHKMPIISKVKAAISGLVFPRFNKKWAFKIHWNDTFSYINNPGCGCYRSMSAAGPAALWKKKSLINMHFEDELWLDKLGFAYGDDGLEFYKLHLNGGKLMVTFDSGVINLDAKTASSCYQNNPQKFYVMAKALTIRWHRMHFKPARSKIIRFLKIISFFSRLLWQLTILLVVSSSKSYWNAPYHFIKGLSSGFQFIKSSEYKAIPSYLQETAIKSMFKS